MEDGPSGKFRLGRRTVVGRGDRQWSRWEGQAVAEGRREDSWRPGKAWGCRCKRDQGAWRGATGSLIERGLKVMAGRKKKEGGGWVTKNGWSGEEGGGGAAV